MVLTAKELNLTVGKVPAKTIFMPHKKKNGWGIYIVLPLSVLPDSVSAHFLCQTWRFSNEIWNIAFSQEYAG